MHMQHQRVTATCQVVNGFENVLMPIEILMPCRTQVGSSNDKLRMTVSDAPHIDSNSAHSLESLHPLDLGLKTNLKLEDRNTGDLKSYIVLVTPQSPIGSSA